MIGERFTKEARQAVLDAVKVAEREQAGEIAPRHLLLALMDAPVLAEYSLPHEEVRAAFQEAQRKGGLTQTDVDALRSLGIDVDSIIDNVERSLGEGALARPRRRKRWFGTPLEPGMKKTLERSLIEARDLGHNYLGTEHIVLALLQDKGIVTEVLGSHGVHYTDVRKRVAAT